LFVFARTTSSNQPVPTEQFAAVAEVLRYVYELKGEMPESLRPAA